MTAPTPDLAAWKAAAERATYYGGNEQEQADRILALIALVEQQAAEIERLAEVEAERDTWKTAAGRRLQRAHEAENAQWAAEARETALREAVEALADEWDRHSDRIYAEARDAEREAAIVLRSKSGTYATNAERLAALLAEHATPSDPTTGEGVGTGADEGAPGQDTGSAWVTRSADCPEAPAQAHPLATPSDRAEAREAALVAKVAAMVEECGSSGCIHLNDLWGRLRTLLAEHATPSGPPCGEDKQRAARGVVHMAPEPGHGTTPCCRMVPFELPRDHRMTTTPKEVTCPAPASVETELSEEERRVLRCHCTRLDDVWHHERFCPVPAVGRILSDRLASAERERDVAEDQANAHAQDAIVAEAEVEHLRAVVAAVEALDEGHIAADCRFPDDTCTCTIPLFTLRAALVTAPVQAGTGAEDGEGDRS